MDRLKILFLDPHNGVIANESIDVQGALGYLRRSNHVRALQIVAHIGKRAIYIEHIDPNTIAKELSDFALAR